YWRSKRELLAAVIADNQTRMRAIARQDLGTSAMIEDLARQNLAASRQYLLILTRAFADGLPVGDWPGGFPAVEAILERLGLDTPADHGDEAAGEARRLVAVVVAMLTGWVLIEDQLLDVVGLGVDERVAARETLVAAIETVLRPAIDRAAG
ncbi:MAG TPA: hypothetical protein VK576_03960, partial [Thermoleophilia bacterium]|nr:hypothetical protein [Thermoleophilia bacterium]